MTYEAGKINILNEKKIITYTVRNSSAKSIRITNFAITMATEALRERLSSKLHLTTKTVGEERIRRAKEKDEDVAIFSMFPMEGDPKFRCCLGKDCVLGEPRKAEPGEVSLCSDKYSSSSSEIGRVSFSKLISEFHPA